MPFILTFASFAIVATIFDLDGLWIVSPLIAMFGIEIATLIWMWLKVTFSAN